MTTTVSGAVPRPRNHPDPGPDAEPGTGSRHDGPGRFGDLAVVRLWLLSRVSVFLLVGCAAWILNADTTARHPVAYLQRWTQWDTVWFVRIAKFGYNQHPSLTAPHQLEAFFPGFPLLMRSIHVWTRLDYVVVGLLISLVAGTVAAAALARIAADYARTEDQQRLAERTTLLFAIAPTTVFLSAAYSDALFLAFALTAWLAARRRSWIVAGVLGAGATGVRVQGLFLAAALIVEFLTQRDTKRTSPLGLALLLPFLPVLGYMAWLHQRTGDWLYWRHSEEAGWGRRTVWPWQGLQDALALFRSPVGTGMYLVDIATVVIGIWLSVWLLRQRRWAELTYVGLQVAAFSSDSLWQAYSRYALAWWPLWIVLAQWSLSRRGAFHGLLVGLAPLAVAFSLMFSTGRWVG